MSLQRYLFVVYAIAALSLTQAQQVDYVVKPGDTLWDLANRFDTSATAILETNGLQGQDLFPGAVLKLPNGSNATPQTYVVQLGDTLYDISVAFGLSVDELIAFNAIEGSVIEAGQTLSVTRPTTTPEPLKITVAPGDTLWGIAVAHETTPELIRSANSLTRDVINPGTSLVIPGRYGSASADLGGAAAPEIEVAVGDSLWDIAYRHNTSVTALMSANGLTSESIRVGQKLKVVPNNEIVHAAAPAPNTSPSVGMVWPSNGEITSRFGYRQLRIGGTNMHNGLDIDGNTGDPIRAAVGGVVTFSGWRGGFGNLVIVTNGDTEYYYAHAAEIWVGKGAVVETGQTIATIGSTGRSTGSHLHFEVRVNDVPVDPLLVLEQRATR